MAIYILLYIFIIIIGVIFYHKKPYNKKANKRAVIFVFTAMYFVSSFRGLGVGWDTYNYAYAFTYGLRGIWVRNWEPLFVLLMDIVRHISRSPSVFFCVCNLIIYGGFGFFLLKNTNDSSSVFWSLLFFLSFGFFFSSMNIIRQTIAMSIGINAYTILNIKTNKKNVFLSIVLVVIATLFHKTGFICAFLIIPFLIHINRKTILIVFSSSVLVYFVFPFFMRFITSLFPVYSRYLNTDAGEVRRYLLFAAVEIVIAFLYILLFDPRNENNLEKYRMLFVLGISFVFIVAQRRTELAQRFGYYFEIFLFLAIPQFCNSFSKDHFRTLIKSTLLLLCTAYFAYALNLSGKGCIPYSFIWQ